MIRSKGFLSFQLVFLLLPLVFVTSAYGQTNTIYISLDKNLTWANKQLYGDFAILNASSTVEVELSETNSSLAFIVFQVHSFLYNVTMYNNTLERNYLIMGKNIGLYSSVKPVLDKFYIHNQNDVDLKVYISVHGYEKYDPIPGGCNMELPTAVAPYIQTLVTDYFIQVGLAAPMDYNDPECKFTNNVTVEVYKFYYIPKRTIIDKPSYFNAIQNMMTLEKILEHGEKIVDPRKQRSFALYNGLSHLYVAVAYSNSHKSAYSVYIPTVVNTCDPFDGTNCHKYRDIVPLIMYGTLIILSFLMAHYGHELFKTQMFLNGMLSGVVVTYIVISLTDDLDESALLGASLTSGVCFGSIWLLFWWFYGIPVISVFLPALNVGFLVASIVYYSIPSHMITSLGDLQFWVFFISITLFTAIVLQFFVNYYSNALCSAILGGYAFLFGFNNLVDYSFSYILKNTIRRAVVPGFNKVFPSPLFGSWESMNVGVWVVIVFSGMITQILRNYGHPPFPPPPRSIRCEMPGLSYGAINQATRRPQTTGAKNTSAVNNEKAPLLA